MDEYAHMPGLPSPFGSEDDDLFDGYDEFVPDDLPTPGEFLDGHDVLTGADHAAFHRLTRECFEERGVYDMTFDYNLPRLNLDTRHGTAGFRYAVERPGALDAVDPAGGDGAASGGDARDSDAPCGGGGDRVLRVEFTPTTAFCPQTHTLTVGAFRAWNGLADRHEYDLVRVRAAPMHNRSDAVNDRLAEFEASYLETGEVSGEPTDQVEASPTEERRGAGAQSGSTDAPR